MDLDRRTVVLTREPPDNAALARLLGAAGLAFEEWPALATRLLPLPDGGPSLADLCARATWCVFTSRRAVRAARRAVGHPAGLRGALLRVRVAAVGPATAKELERDGQTADLVGDGRGAASLAPRLLDSASRGERALLFRSEIADEELPELLRRGGLEVDELPLHGPARPAPVSRRRRPLGCVACSSPSAARHLLGWNPWLAAERFVAIGPTTARALTEELGVRAVTVADGPEPEDMLAAIERALGEERTDGVLRRDRSERAFERARAVSPGGVHSPVRAFRAVGGTPVFLERAKGSAVWDVDGNRFVDFCQSWGPLILGHAHPPVVEAVQAAAARGLSFGACHEAEAALCEEILAGVPDADRVRLVNSGTEAVMTALRLARAATGRPFVLKFEGGYHGHSDGLLVQAGSGLATLGVATSAGVPEAVAATTLVAPLADREALEATFAEHGGQLACVVLEPVPANAGLLPQAPAFLQRLRELCDAHGTLLLFDEVITGFRLRRGSAAPLVGVRPDLVTLGKIVGGGLPIGAVAGPAALMDLLAPVGGVYQAGTLSGNPVSVAAGLATLRELDDASYVRLEELGLILERSLQDAPPWLHLQRRGSLAWLHLAEGPLPDRADRIEPAAVERFTTLHGRLLDRGFYLPPSAHEVFFLSLAHSDAEVEGLGTAVREEARTLG